MSNAIDQFSVFHRLDTLHTDTLDALRELGSIVHPTLGGVRRFVMGVPMRDNESEVDLGFCDIPMGPWSVRAQYMPYCDRVDISATDDFDEITIQSGEHSTVLLCPGELWLELSMLTDWLASKYRDC